MDTSADSQMILHAYSLGQKSIMDPIFHIRINDPNITQKYLESNLYPYFTPDSKYYNCSIEQLNRMIQTDTKFVCSKCGDRLNKISDIIPHIKSEYPETKFVLKLVSETNQIGGKEKSVKHKLNNNDYHRQKNILCRSALKKSDQVYQEIVDQHK